MTVAVGLGPGPMGPSLGGAVMTAPARIGKRIRLQDPMTVAVGLDTGPMGQSLGAPVIRAPARMGNRVRLQDPMTLAVGLGTERELGCMIP